LAIEGACVRAEREIKRLNTTHTLGRIRRFLERIAGDEIRRQMLDIAAHYVVVAESEERQPR